VTRPVDPRSPVTSHTTVRVRYPETDRMGVVYHGNYMVWFEIGRTELMRELDCTYGELEDRDSIYFPVVEIGARFHAPARYDELLDVNTILVSVGGARVRFEYEVSRREDAQKLATGYTVHAAVGEQGQPMRLPEELRRRLTGRGVH